MRTKREWLGFLFVFALLNVYVSGTFILLCWNGLVGLLFLACVKLKNIVLRVYSSINPDGLGRGCGEDAIRCVLFDTELNRPIGCSKRTNRTQNWKQNLLQKARELYTSIKMYKCPCCKHFMVERKGAKGSFLGCSSYPACKHTEDINKEILQFRGNVK